MALLGLLGVLLIDYDYSLIDLYISADHGRARERRASIKSNFIITCT